MSQFTKCTEYSGEGVYIRFMPVCNVPGFSHRVIIMDDDRKLIATDWLASHTRVSEKAAVYFFRKHGRVSGRLVNLRGS